MPLNLALIYDSNPGFRLHAPYKIVSFSYGFHSLLFTEPLSGFHKNVRLSYGSAIDLYATRGTCPSDEVFTVHVL